MTAVTSKIGSLLDQMVADLALRPGLAGVSIRSSDPGLDRLKQKNLVFLSGHVDREWTGMGESSVYERYSIQGDILFIGSGGAPEDNAKAARDGALAIFAELESYVSEDWTFNGEALGGEITGFDYDSGPWVGSISGEAFEVTFTITARTEISP